jgi:hypothetical protein
MTKNGIAISISFVFLCLCFFVTFLLGKEPAKGFALASPLALYWAYRLAKYNASPLKKNDKDITLIGSKADALLKWNDLLAKGAITQEEYEKAKRDLLS